MELMIQSIRYVVDVVATQNDTVMTTFSSDCSVEYSIDLNIIEMGSIEYSIKKIVIKIFIC
jgi:hypothetical protein